MTIHKNFIAASALMAVVALTGCSKGDVAKTASDAPKEPSSPVLAVVNGKEITAEEFKEEAANLNPMAQAALTNDEVNKRKFLDSLVDRKLVIEKAESLGMDKDPEVTKKLEKLRGDLLLQNFIKKEVFDKATVTDEEVKAYFDAHREELGSVRLSHIVIGSQSEAEKVIAKLGSGTDFKKVASQFSLDPRTKDAGGDLGMLKWADFGSTSLKDEAFKLKKGEVSGVIVSQYGYHILKVTDKKPAADADFAAVKDQLKVQLEQKKKEERLESVIKEMKATPKFKETFKVYSGNLKAVKLDAPEMGDPSQPGGIQQQVR